MPCFLTWSACFLVSSQLSGDPCDSKPIAQTYDPSLIAVDSDFCVFFTAHRDLPALAILNYNLTLASARNARTLGLIGFVLNAVVFAFLVLAVPSQARATVSRHLDCNGIKPYRIASS